ncbi:MAG: 50S ribosome-binding GTPase, partial [Planctomycetota bacterium]|nr:50S ribosome-binding GTPase [Planctomycetota bacterium]
MGLNDTPSAERLHIAFLGCRNAGKSSLVNAVTGQSLAIVSPLGGTTTDPVLKAMELLPLGPVVIIDTPGMDDRGELGELRVGKARQVLNRADLAVLVVDAGRGLTPADQELLASIEERHLPHIVVFNKSDLPGALAPPAGGLAVSAVSGLNLPLLKERLASLAETDQPKLQLVGDLLRPGELVVLVTPIDKSAPKGRLILPQQQTIRDVL